MKRHTNGENMSSLSYRHAIAALKVPRFVQVLFEHNINLVTTKAYPREITSAKEAQQIKGPDSILAGNTPTVPNTIFGRHRAKDQAIDQTFPQDWDYPRSKTG